MMKRCTKCGEEKDVGEFYRDKNRKDECYPLCKSCVSEYQKERYRQNPEKFKERSDKWVNENRFTRALISSRALAKRRDYIPCTATKEELEVAFTGRCRICGVPEQECTRKLAMDHDHETGEFRGWLCQGCNQGIGNFRNSREVILNALLYIQCSEAKQKNNNDKVVK